MGKAVRRIEKLCHSEPLSSVRDWETFLYPILTHDSVKNKILNMHQNNFLT